MFLRRFSYACFAILCLVLAYHFGATSARAQIPGMVRWVGDGDDPYFATSSGVYVALDSRWATLAEWGALEPPVPADQVLRYTSSKMVTTSGELYYRFGSQWVSKGFIPGGDATTVQAETWGGIKSKFKK